MSITYQSHYIPVQQTDTGTGKVVDQLHLMRIYNPENIGLPVFMLHGSIENGRIFYSSNNKGLAPFLAEHGFDVYVGDLRGKGSSKPAIGPQSSFGQTEAITEDIPAFLHSIVKLRGPVPQFWVAHSWGGVLLSSYFARYPEYRHLVKGMVYFAVKRSVRVYNWQRFLVIDLIWKNLTQLLVSYYGYVPAKKYHLGSDDETANMYRQSLAWVKPKPWIDPVDGFDYGKAIKTAHLPLILYFAGKKDHYLGHPNDVKDFINESGSDKARFIILGESEGNLHDYDHISILTEPDARKDHFCAVLDFLRSNS